MDVDEVESPRLTPSVKMADKPRVSPFLCYLFSINSHVGCFISKAIRVNIKLDPTPVQILIHYLHLPLLVKNLIEDIETKCDQEHDILVKRQNKKRENYM